MPTVMALTKPEPAAIQYRGMKFLITDRPTDMSMDNYIEELKKHEACDVVRVCDPTYSAKRLKAAGITVTDLQFDDGTGPPYEVVEKFFDLLRTRFLEAPGCCIAVHCVAGLGRAPVLVAIALIEAGMKYEDAVALIRMKRRGAINARQLSYLEGYRSKSRLKIKGRSAGCCIQ